MNLMKSQGCTPQTSRCVYCEPIAFFPIDAHAIWLLGHGTVAEPDPSWVTRFSASQNVRTLCLHVSDVISPDISRICREAYGFFSPDDMKGAYFLVDVDLFAIAVPNGAPTADAADFLFPSDLHHVCHELLNLLLSKRPSTDELRCTWIHCGVVKDQYSCIVKAFISTSMARLYPLSESTVENSVFGVWKSRGTSQCLVWGDERANQMVHPHPSAFFLC